GRLSRAFHSPRPVEIRRGIHPPRHRAVPSLRDRGTRTAKSWRFTTSSLTCLRLFDRESPSPVLKVVGGRRLSRAECVSLCLLRGARSGLGSLTGTLAEQAYVPATPQRPQCRGVSFPDSFLLLRRRNRSDRARQGRGLCQWRLQRH